jgi:hypothetical protein
VPGFFRLENSSGINTASGFPQLRDSIGKIVFQFQPTLGKTNGNPGNLILVATREEFVPIAAKHGTQTHQRWQAGEVVASLHVLNVAGAHANFFGKSFLGQILPCLGGRTTLGCFSDGSQAAQRRRLVPRIPGGVFTKSEAQRALKTCKAFRKEARVSLGLPAKC